MHTCVTEGAVLGFSGEQTVLCMGRFLESGPRLMPVEGAGRQGWAELLRRPTA